MLTLHANGVWQAFLERFSLTTKLRRVPGRYAKRVGEPNISLPFVAGNNYSCTLVR